MSDADLRARADARFQAALEASGARDPREFYREQLRALRAADRQAYDRALSYYEERLIPAVAAEDSDPLGEWLEYGRLLASLSLPGRTVLIDPSGGAADYARPVPADALALHLPESAGRPALLLGAPPKLSPAQRASYELLVKQSQG